MNNKEQNRNSKRNKPQNDSISIRELLDEETIKYMYNCTKRKKTNHKK